MEGVPAEPDPDVAALLELWRGTRERIAERRSYEGKIRQLQATHCYEPPAWKGIWPDRKGRSWYVEACAQHAPKVSETRSTVVTGVKEER
jgi:hypothetical protein